MENNKNENLEKKKKSRFGMVLGVLIVILAMVFALLVAAQKESYKVLDNSSREVASKISQIKDYRTLKGYKILEDNGKYKLILISAGLSYDKEATLEVEDIEFKKDSISIHVKENINQNPEKEVVNYPFVIVKVDTKIDDIFVYNQTGEQYSEIVINGDDVAELEEGDVGESNQVNIDEDANSSEEDNEDENEESEIENSEDEENVNTKVLTCVFQGRIDSNSIEVSVGDTYRTFDVTEVQNSFANIEIGTSITVEYIDSTVGQKIINVR